MAGPTGGAAEIARAVEITAEVPQIEGTWRDWRRFPYWLVGIAAILVWIAYLVITQERYQQAWDRIVPGIRLTIEVTFWAFLIALAFGMVLGLGRIARNVVIRNVAIFYIEFIRGVPILVLIFTIAYAVVPTVADALGFSATSVDFKWRAIIALALIYAAYLAEVLRAGIESISKGQTEAGRALGMTSRPDAAPHRVAAGGPQHHARPRQRLDRDVEGHLARLRVGRAGHHAERAASTRARASTSRRRIRSCSACTCR